MSRPRDDEVDAAIHGATLSLLAEVGYDGVTVAEVARRASTVPPTVYRRYRNVRDLVLATLRQAFAEVGHREVADLGELRADLLSFVTQVAAALTAERVAILAGLLLPLRRDAQLASALRTELEFLSTGSWQVIITRAIRRGELAIDLDAADLSAVTAAAPAVIFHRLVLLNLPLDDDFARDLVDTVLLPSLHRAAAAHTARTGGHDPIRPQQEVSS
jgi:AcrR family transcriptional regulator